MMIPRRNCMLTVTLIVCVLISLSNGFMHHSRGSLDLNSGAKDRLSHSHSLSPLSTKRRVVSSRTSLSLATSNKSSNKGVYSRPSAAIERGSGFFVPGLEGPRVRLVFGLVVLVLTVLNHVLLSSTLTATVAFPERLALVYAVLILLQAAIEFGKEEKGYVVTLQETDETEAASSPSYSQTWSPQWSTISDNVKETVEWAAASYVGLTPATQMLLLDRNDGAVYRLLGSTLLAGDYANKEDELVGTTAAFAALDKASSGRVSLPATHPTVTSLNTDPEHGRCAVLQRINDNQCWMMTSNQLLQAFTQDDLKWLGQLAKHVNEQ